MFKFPFKILPNITKKNLNVHFILGNAGHA